MLDHISLRVRDFPRALAFYRAALAPIGYEVVMEFPDAAGLGEKGKPDLWVTRTDQEIAPTHLAFLSERKLVDAFHAAALAAGAVDNGAPGLRTDYHPNYYSAFVLDPEGNNIEVVCHEPPASARVASASRSASASASKGRAKAKAKPAAKAKAKAKPVRKAAAKPSIKKKAAKKRR
jgi:catechol 2,3-dioxygenase-like lactoylglutathione lyase family enzyme